MSCGSNADAMGIVTITINEKKVDIMSQLEERWRPKKIEEQIYR